jgi:hypothetical protein
MLVLQSTCERAAVRFQTFAQPMQLCTAHNADTMYDSPKQAS